jgi:hypothetical protein
MVFNETAEVAEWRISVGTVWRSNVVVPRLIDCPPPVGQ